jgi:hypothetical protein
MPVHDWTRVKAGLFHHFHSGWVTHLTEALNGGLLPKGYYALAEQHAGQVIADVLRLEVDDRAPPMSPQTEAVAVAEAPPRVSQRMVASENAAYRALRKTIAIRHVSDHRLISLIEFLSPANKDRPQSVRDFVEKAIAALRAGCHLLVVDLFAPGRHDAHGIHGAIWEYFDPDDYLPPADRPLMLAAYEALDMPQAYLEPIAIGDELPSMPLFLQPARHILAPLEATYQTACRGVPEYWRGVLETVDGVQ